MVLKSIPKAFLDFFRFKLYIKYRIFVNSFGFLTMSDNKERTFLMIKPDAVHRALIADIIKRFEQKGFKLVAMKFMKVRVICRF